MSIRCQLAKRVKLRVAEILLGTYMHTLHTTVCYLVITR